MAKDHYVQSVDAQPAGYRGDVHHSLPPTQLADYDFLRATYEALLRASAPDREAINAAFDALDAAHERFRAAHRARFGPTGMH